MSFHYDWTVQILHKFEQLKRVDCGVGTELKKKKKKKLIEMGQRIS
jgi:hypothetical protein